MDTATPHAAGVTRPKFRLCEDVREEVVIVSRRKGLHKDGRRIANGWQE